MDGKAAEMSNAAIPPNGEFWKAKVSALDSMSIMLSPIWRFRAPADSNTPSLRMVRTSNKDECGSQLVSIWGCIL